jgi:hypothetical protein
MMSCCLNAQVEGPHDELSPSTVPFFEVSASDLLQRTNSVPPVGFVRNPASGAHFFASCFSVGGGFLMGHSAESVRADGK